MSRLFHSYPVNRLILAGLGMAYVAGICLVAYEFTAKSPALLGDPLPGWWATERAERTTRWNPPTGLLPLDKLLHESEEAFRFYRILAHLPAVATPVSGTVS